MPDEAPYCARCRSFCNGSNALCPCCQAIGVGQRHRLAEDVMRGYESRIPGAREARLRDPQSSYSWELLRHLLAVADAAMQDEGVTPRTRQRVLSAVMYGGQSPADAEQRQRDAQNRLREYQASTPTVFVSPEAFEGLAARCGPTAAMVEPAAAAATIPMDGPVEFAPGRFVRLTRDIDGRRAGTVWMISGEVLLRPQDQGKLALCADPGTPDYRTMKCPPDALEWADGEESLDA